MVDFHVVIPARYDSSRFPGKLLKLLAGKPVLEHVYRRVCFATPKTITIATDHESIATVAKQWGANVVNTAVTHASGTDRIAEAVETLNLHPDDIVVNVQGDEPLIPTALISQVAVCLANTNAPMATLCWPIYDVEKANNPNVVKVVCDQQGYALYFSRSIVPFARDVSLQEQLKAGALQSHIGIYAYRVGFLRQFVQWSRCSLEETECLEQLRALWFGQKIKVERACVAPQQDINTPDDLLIAEQLLSFKHAVSSVT